ncbi:hypothetical protein ABPG74_013800 [Tetrahymena malaccensis]
MSSQQPRNIFQNYSQTQISNKIKEILNEKKQHKSLQSPKDTQIRVSSTNKTKISQNTRPMTSQQQLLYYLQKSQQQSQIIDQNKNSDNQVSNGAQQNIYRQKFQRISLDSSPQVSNYDQNLRLTTSFPQSPSMNYHFQKGIYTCMPTDSDYSETKQFTNFSTNISSSPLQKNMQILGYNNQKNIDRSVQQNEIYVMHNALGNKYRNKLNSQVKAKLNKKNEIIKQFLTKNMIPSQSNGFFKWLDSVEQIKQDVSQQEQDLRYIHKSPSHNQLLNKYNQKKIEYIYQYNDSSPLMLGGKNRDFIINQQINQIRPATSLLQRSKLLIPQTIASKDFNVQKQFTVSSMNQAKQNQFQNQRKLTNSHQQQPEKVDQANQSFEENYDNNFVLQIPQQQNSYLIDQTQQEYQLQNNKLKLHQQIFSKINQPENFKDLPLNKQKSSQSSNNSSRRVIIINKSGSQKQFKHQTEQTNFPEQNFSSINSFEDFSMDRERMKSVEGSEAKSKQISISQQKNKAQSNIQIGAYKPSQAKSASQIFNKSSTQISQQIQQIKLNDTQKSNLNIKEEFRKKSIRGWSFVSEDEIQETLTLRQNNKCKEN